MLLPNILQPFIRRRANRAVHPSLLKSEKPWSVTSQLLTVIRQQKMCHFHWIPRACPISLATPRPGLLSHWTDAMGLGTELQQGVGYYWHSAGMKRLCQKIKPVLKMCSRQLFFFFFRCLVSSWTTEECYKKTTALINKFMTLMPI